jgi:serine-type D-Ala-D-Ala carboxypeptidase/endopeptidase (penicillin-binding protein 4)
VGALWVPVRDPSRQAALLFRTRAWERDVHLPEPVPGRIGQQRTVLAEHVSPPLDEIAVQALRYSNNLVSEVLGLQASKRLGLQQPPLDQSARALFAWMRSALPDGGWDSFHVENHSGLSAAARATPRQMIAMLLYGAFRTYGEDDFLALLRPARWLGPREPFAVRAKTGTMHYASGLAGVIEHRSGRRLLFAVFNTDYAARAELERNPNRYQADVQRSARAWTGRARRLEERLVRHWAGALGSGAL